MASIKETINWLIFIGFAKNEREIAEKFGLQKDFALSNSETKI